MSNRQPPQSNYSWSYEADLSSKDDFRDPEVAMLFIHNRIAKRVRLPINSEFIIGRRHQIEFTQPDLDLTQYQAADYGVSRLHARLFHNVYGWWLEDLGSVNGTYVNGIQLTSQVPMRLEVKNRIMLGHMNLYMVLPHKAYGSMVVPIEAPNAIPMHIVHIEDDAPLQELFRTALHEVAPHIKLTQFTSAENATGFITANAGTIDLYIVDIRLPGHMNGIEIAHMIRKAGCPGFIVLTSAYGSLPPQLLARLDCEFLPKPMHMLNVLPRLLNYRITRTTSQAHDLAAYRAAQPEQQTRILTREDLPDGAQINTDDQSRVIGGGNPPAGVISDSVIGKSLSKLTSRKEQAEPNEKPTKGVLQRLLRKLQSL